MDQNDGKRWTNLGASLLIILAGGTVYAFGAYSEALKKKLHLTQAQLELAALCGNLGNYLGTAGFFYDRYGAVASAKFGATLIGLGYGLQWLLCVYFESDHAIEFLCVFCFVWGHGSGYLDCAAIGSGVRAFPRRRGAVVGLLKSFYGLASSLIILGAAPWLSGVNFIVALAVFAGGLPLLALCKFEDVPDRAPEGTIDSGRGRPLQSMRVVAFALWRCYRVARVGRRRRWVLMWRSRRHRRGLAWIVRAAARARPASLFSRGGGVCPSVSAVDAGGHKRGRPSRTRRRRKRTRTSRRPRPQSTTRALRDPVAELRLLLLPSCRAPGWASRPPTPADTRRAAPGVAAARGHGRRERRERLGAGCGARG